MHRWLIDNHEKEPLFSPNFRTGHEHKPKAWRLAGDMFIIGRYTAGADGVSFPELMDCTRAFAPVGHVFFENVMVSANISSWLPVRQQLAEHDWLWMTLDTPLETCIARIYGRNGDKPIKEGAITQHHNRVKRHAVQLAEMGERSVWIDHTRSIENVHELLMENGWKCGH